MGSLWPRSGTIERYADDIRAAAAQAFFYQGGTTSPITVYGDSGESEAHPFPVLADSQGRWPDIFIPYSVAGYDVQVKSAQNVQLTYTQSIPNPNPIAVSPPPATDGLQTGMIHGEFVNSTKAGFVRLNGRTIGSATSSPLATERANADTLNLFTYLWNNLPDAICPVSGGRGVSAAADFSPGNKTIQLVDARGSGLIGLDDMGNSAASRFAAQSFISGHSAIIAGSACGSNTRTLTIGNMPAHSHTVNAVTGVSTVAAHDHGGNTGNESLHTHTGTTDPGSAHSHGFGTLATDTESTHTHKTSTVAGSYLGATAGTVNFAPGGLVGVGVGPSGTNTGTGTGHSHSVNSGSTGSESLHTHPFTTDPGSAHHHTINPAGSHTHTVTIDPIGGGTAVDNMGNSKLVTWFIKL
jgi:hypothetical protein